MKERQYFLIFVLVTVAILGIAATISYSNDPTGAFSNNAYENGIADFMLSGHNVGNIEKNYDERLLQRDLIRKDHRNVDIIVLGSSRSMSLRKSLLGGNHSSNAVFLNHGVSGASIEDYIAILEMYKEKGSIPGTVIIGVDPWILNANNDQKRWKTLETEYENGMEILSPAHKVSSRELYDIKKDLGRYASLISRPVIVESLKTMGSQSYYPTDLEESDVAIRLQDGSISYQESFRNHTAKEIDKDATTYADAAPIYSLGNFEYLDEKNRLSFESTLQYLKNRNTTVILFLPPYHPIVYMKIDSDPNYFMVKESELYFRDLAKKENITLIGSYDPDVQNFTSVDFYDGMHARPEALKKIFAAVTFDKKGPST